MWGALCALGFTSFNFSDVDPVGLGADLKLRQHDFYLTRGFSFESDGEVNGKESRPGRRRPQRLRLSQAATRARPSESVAGGLSFHLPGPGCRGPEAPSGVRARVKELCVGRRDLGSFADFYL